jgi:hypothetical protein
MSNNSSKGSAKRRPISDKRFNKLEDNLRKRSQTVNSLEDEVASLDEIISTKVLTVQPKKKGDDPVTVHLSNAEVDGYKLKLKKAKNNRRQARKALKKAENEYTDACKHNAACEMEKSKKFSSGLAAEYTAKREMDESKEKVVNIVKNLQTTDDPKFTSLLTAVQDGYYSFRKKMDAILQEEDESTYTSISGLSSVKTKIYKSVKVELFSGSVVDDSAENDNDDDEEDNSAAVKPAG